MRIEHTLHGYDDGHRLLMSTVELNRSAKYVMLALSDMSGRSMIEGYQEYLTGYPVPGTGFYAFAKTWYAPEMDRPGCVWTHTLLIKKEDLGGLDGCGQLRTLFIRPDSSDLISNWHRYSESLECDQLCKDGAELIGNDDTVTTMSVLALYQMPKASVFVEAANSVDLEEMVLALWSQQWPGLRCSFRFCTGAISDRSTKSHTFDLQVVPRSSIREIKRESRDPVVIYSGMHVTAVGDPPWVKIVLDDLRRKQSGFRNFIKGLQPETSDRSGLIPLAELYECDCEFFATIAPDVSSFLSTIGKCFAEPLSGLRLKMETAGKSGFITSKLFPNIGETALLTAVARLAFATPFDLPQLEFEGRAKQLLNQEPDDALDLLTSLAQSDNNAIGKRLLVALMHGVTVDYVLRLSRTAPAIMPLILHIAPQFAVNESIWRGSQKLQREMFDAATRDYEMNDVELREMLVGMLNAGSDAAASMVFRRFDGRAVSSMMAWLNESNLNPATTLSTGWREAISKDPLSLLDWLCMADDVREASAAFVASVVNPHSASVQIRGAAPWLRSIRIQNEWHEDSSSKNYRGFLFALSLDNPPGPADTLASFVFESVHHALASRELKIEVWDYLESVLPTLHWLRNWDKCERLRRGMIDAYVRFQWPISSFFECTSDRELLSSLLGSCSETDTGKEFLAKCASAIQTGAISLSEDKKSLVQWYLP